MTLRRKKTKGNKKSEGKKKGRNWVYWIIYVTVVAIVLFFAVKIVRQKVKILSLSEELSEKKDTISLQQIKLAEQKKDADAADKDDLDSLKDNIEKKARELDYVRPGEIVFINIAGD